MFDFFQKLIEKTVSKKSKRALKTTSKKTFSEAASFESIGETEKTKAKLENAMQVILKKFGDNPDALLVFVEKNGTEVYRLASADKFLRLIGIEQGFLITQKGFKSFYINTIVAAFAGKKIKLSFEAEPKFILSNKPIDKYFMIQQFYKWYAKKLNLSGFEPETQDKLQKLMSSSDEDIKNLSIEEILELKEAIARDRESIDFIIDMAKNTEGSQNALKKMTDGGASI